ncbi:TPA: hypothetical protein VGS93_005463 [Bacillus cereus]|nr:hypothetical protein [Bacillus cereus]
MSKKGYDMWAMDFRGFEQSSRSKEMSGAPHLHKPVVHLNDVTKDVALFKEVLNFIKMKEGIKE